MTVQPLFAGRRDMCVFCDQFPGVHLTDDLEPICDPCGEGCTYCRSCLDDARHMHCRGLHPTVPECLCEEPCDNPFCTCPAVPGSSPVAGVEPVEGTA